MRKTIRAVGKDGFSNVAVVCGAWHAPVLDAEGIAGKRLGCKIKDDNERLSGLPKVKTTATWIPWTYSRLTYRSGYGAGIHSPGWYAHLWESNDDAPTRWLATAARLLRAKDLDASSASIIEARHLADALAAIREIRSPGLAELTEAILTVLCHGEPAPLRLIRSALEIGDVVGEVPPEMPSVPLAQVTAWRAPQNSASAASRARTSGPRMNWQCSSTRATAASIRPPSARRWAATSTNGIGVSAIRSCRFMI